MAKQRFRVREISTTLYRQGCGSGQRGRSSIRVEHGVSQAIRMPIRTTSTTGTFTEVEEVSDSEELTEITDGRPAMDCQVSTYIRRNSDRREEGGRMHMLQLFSNRTYAEELAQACYRV